MKALNKPEMYVSYSSIGLYLKETPGLMKVFIWMIGTISKSASLRHSSVETQASSEQTEPDWADLYCT